MNERHRRRLLLIISLLAVAVAPLPDVAQEVPRGLTTAVLLPPYKAGEPDCSAPVGLTPELVFVQDNERDFMKGAKAGLQAAAADQHLPFKVDLANNDPKLMVQEVQNLIAEKAGAVVVAPVDPPSLAPHLQQMIVQGNYVGAVVPPPATTILNAPQYLTGKVLGEAAVAYIKNHLGGKADVVILTHDSLQVLAPRFRAIRDALEQLPGATIIADISPPTVDRAGGKEVMNTILLANPNVDVVLGADTVVLGALDAIREAHKDRPDQFFGGIDGEPEALAEIEKKDSPYKITVSLASPIFGYALGYQAGEWLKGKTIPQAIDALPRTLTAENLIAYRADMADPGAVYADPVKRGQYLKMYGNICFDTKEQYLNFPWSSEPQ